MIYDTLIRENFVRQGHRIYLTSGAQTQSLAASQVAGAAAANFPLPNLGVRDALYVVTSSASAWDAGITGKIVLNDLAFEYVTSSGPIYLARRSIGPTTGTAAGNILGPIPGGKQTVNLDEQVFYGRDLFQMLQGGSTWVNSFGICASNLDGAAAHTISFQFDAAIEIWRQ